VINNSVTIGSGAIHAQTQITAQPQHLTLQPLLSGANSRTVADMGLAVSF
jgi:hypothetical protein